MRSEDEAHDRRGRERRQHGRRDPERTPASLRRRRRLCRARFRDDLGRSCRWRSHNADQRRGRREFGLLPLGKQLTFDGPRSP